MSVIDAILEGAGATGATILFPESDDPRVREAARVLHERRIVRPLLLGGEVGDLPTLPLEAHRAEVLDALHAAASASRREVDPARIEAWSLQPLMIAAALVRAGIVDGTVAGAVHSTSETIGAALRVIRRAPEAPLVSSFFLMELREPTPGGERTLVFADGALVPRPDAAQLAAIAAQSADHFRRLTDRDPRVAMLSFSTAGSAEHEEVERVREATRRLRAARSDLKVSGELQLDAAIVPEVAKKKAPRCLIQGRSNVLVFPDLGAGNIGYKLVERLAGARAIGPILQGLARPANDLSRGCAAEEIVVVSAITALQAKGG